MPVYADGDDALITTISQTFEEKQLDNADLRAALQSYINALITHRFEYLVSLLYRLDVNEEKLRQTLDNAGETDAAAVIANLIIERQLQKIKSRQQYYRDSNDISEDERW